MRNSELERVMVVSCERLSLERNDIRFVYKGHYVSAKATPDQLGMEDGDVIDAISVRPLNQLTTDPADIYLLVKVNGQDLGIQETTFRMKKSTKLKRLMTMYCDRYSLPAECLYFWFKGRRLDDVEYTADELEMEDGEEIYVMRHLLSCEKCSSRPVPVVI